MISVEQAEAVLKDRLQSVEKIDDYVLRGVKRYKDRPYAVFYVDVSGNVQERAKQLTQFQDRVLGPRYFDEGDDLRWNSYLLLLAERSQFSKNSFIHARSIVESDRNYARKFVVPEDELAECLDSRPATEDLVQPKATDVLRTWDTLLADVGLEDILDDKEIASILREFLGGPSRSKTKTVKAHVDTADDGVASSFLEHLELRSFREYPRTTDFNFGTVNLIQGVNGSGKTTLLEAIEYFYCGRNRRSDSPKGARVAATLKDSHPVIETSSATAQQKFRDRHLRWYGKQDIRRNLMPDSFANFNFLNTDAAVHLSMDRDPVQLRSDLATLLVGAEAGRVWDRIGRVYRELKPESKSLEEQLEAISSKIKAHEERLATAKAVVRKSDELFTLLKGHLNKLNWRRIPDTKEAAANDTETNLIEIESLLQSVSALRHLPSSLTLDSIDTALRLSKGLLDRAILLWNQYSEFDAKRRESQGRMQERVTSSGELRELAPYVSVGFLELVATVERLHADVARLTAEIGGFQVGDISSEEVVSADSPLAEFHTQILKREKALEDAAQTAKKLFDAFSQEQERAASLSQELRLLAQTILAGGADENTCPLCHTKFEPGELQTHIQREIDVARDARALEMWKEVELAQQKYLEAQILAKQVYGLLQFARRHKLDDRSVSTKDAIAALRQVIANLAQTEQDLEQFQSRLDALKASGLNTQRATLLYRKLFPQSSSDITDATIRDALAVNDRETSRLTEEISQLDAKMETLRQSLNILRKEASLTGEIDFEQMVNELQKRVDDLALASSSLEKIETALVIDKRSPLTGVLSSLRVAGSLQDQLRQALALEVVADKSVADANQALAGAREEEVKTRNSVKRLQDALSVLSEILEKHSLESVSRELLEANQSQVAKIFSRIHSPHEFEVSIADGEYLQKITTGESIKLNEISTGQRAAFALAIFFAMNTHAKNAPPVILIDDPVAHVDDLNTLSFLDYLRDVAIVGGRQIFFATADDKLGGLFEHKFSFLREEFRKYLLSRD